MKRIIILAAAAMLLFPLSNVQCAAKPVEGSVSTSVNRQDDPLKQILSVMSQIVEIKQELDKKNPDTSGGKVNQDALNAGAQVIMLLLSLNEVSEKYGEMPLTDSDRSQMIEFLIKNYETLNSKPITDEAAKEIVQQVNQYKTYNDLLAGLVVD